MTLITSEERASQAAGEDPTGPRTFRRKELSNHNMLLKGRAGCARLPLLTAPVHVKLLLLPRHNRRYTEPGRPPRSPWSSHRWTQNGCCSQGLLLSNLTRGPDQHGIAFLPFSPGVCQFPGKESSFWLGSSRYLVECIQHWLPTLSPKTLLPNCWPTCQTLIPVLGCFHHSLAFKIGASLAFFCSGFTQGSASISCTCSQPFSPAC